jgi:hypothetical protein
MQTRSIGAASAAVLVVVGCAGAAFGQGSVFLTGHDPDFHASQGGNALGAQHINQRAIEYIMDPAFNPYVAGGATKFLFVNSKISPPGGHIDGELGIQASGYVAGVDYDEHDANTLIGALGQLGTVYGAIVVASDFGGILTQRELNTLNGHRLDIFDFINNGGGLYAMAEGNNGAGLTPDGGWFEFVPVAASAHNDNQTETGFTVTAFGASLGLVDADVNGNFSHNIFTTWDPALSPVDLDNQGQVLSLAGRFRIPAPSVVAPLAMGLLMVRRRRR